MTELRAFAGEVLATAERFPWRALPAEALDPEGEDQPRQFLWHRYQYACVVAGRRVFRSILVNYDAGLEFESAMPLRSLMELISIQHALVHDEGGVFKLLAEATVARQTATGAMVDVARRHDLTWESEPLRERQDRYRTLIESHVESFPPDGSMPWPFGKRPKGRLSAAGLDAEWYDLFYRRASNLIHMNAAVLESYVRWDATQGFVLPALKEESAFLLDRGVWLLFRLLRRADTALQQGKGDYLERLHERWKDEVSPSWRDFRAEGLAE